MNPCQRHERRRRRQHPGAARVSIVRLSQKRDGGAQLVRVVAVTLDDSRSDASPAPTPAPSSTADAAPVVVIVVAAAETQVFDRDGAPDNSVNARQRVRDGRLENVLRG